ncbi:MAG TPA: CsgG/HfaB family protein, partial [Thermodesulfobacteriota bacterium]|nr:CsgG/HfaB family protein [Thermodesulfobacteriota bacterium]
VTNEDRVWAQKLLAQEQALRAETARNTVGVLYFKNGTGRPDLDPLQKGIALMLITDLSQVKSLQVVERAQLQALVEEMGLGKSGLVDPATAPRVGKLLGSRWLIGGDFIRGKVEELRIGSEVLEVAAGKTVAQPFSEGKLQDLFSMEKNLLFDVVKALNVEPTAEEQDRMRVPCSTSPRALMSLFKGVDASDRGDYARAAEFYRAAVKDDPKICIAGGALEELQGMGLIGGKKKSEDLLRSLRHDTSFNDQLTPKEAERREKTPKDVTTPARIGVVFP